MQTQLPASVMQPGWENRFVEMLPQIEAFARRAFRKCHQELRDELIAAVVADTFLAFRRLVELGREADAFPSVLTNFSVRRIGSGICVGTSRNRYDVSSRYGQLRTGAQVQSLQWQDDRDDDWNDLVVEDRRQGCPAQVAALRVDLRAWLRTLSIRDRTIALLLAVGERTSDVAQRLGLTAGRVSQLRRTLARSWIDYHGFDPADREFAWMTGAGVPATDTVRGSMIKQPAGQRRADRSQSANLPGDPADLLANVRSRADCLEEWAAIHRRAIPVSPVASAPGTEAGRTYTTIHQEPLPC